MSQSHTLPGRPGPTWPLRHHARPGHHPRFAQSPHGFHLVSLVQALLPVVELLVQVALLLTEQLLEHKGTRVWASWWTWWRWAAGPACTHLSLSRSTIFRSQGPTPSPRSAGATGHRQKVPAAASPVTPGSAEPASRPQGDGLAVALPALPWGGRAQPQRESELAASWPVPTQVQVRLQAPPLSPA